jgi:hypothetical protein
LIRLSMPDAAHRERKRPEAAILRHRLRPRRSRAAWRHRPEVGAGTTAIQAVKL